MKRPRPLGLAVVCALSAGIAAVAQADEAAPWREHSRSRSAAVAYGAERLEDAAGVLFFPQGQQRQESQRERVKEPRHSVGAASVHARRLVDASAPPTSTPSAVTGSGVTLAPTPAAITAVATASASTSASTTHYLTASTSASATFTTSSLDGETGSSGVEQGARWFQVGSSLDYIV